MPKQIEISDRKCFFHTNATHGFTNRAATCRICYDLALQQQHAQIARAREEAHRVYLAEVGKRMHR